MAHIYILPTEHIGEMQWNVAERIDSLPISTLLIADPHKPPFSELNSTYAVAAEFDQSRLTVWSVDGSYCSNPHVKRDDAIALNGIEHSLEALLLSRTPPDGDASALARRIYVEGPLRSNEVLAAQIVSCAARNIAPIAVVVPWYNAGITADIYQILPAARVSVEQTIGESYVALHHSLMERIERKRNGGKDATAEELFGFAIASDAIFAHDYEGIRVALPDRISVAMLTFLYTAALKGVFVDENERYNPAAALELLRQFSIISSKGRSELPPK
jgi:hypothetical protein